MNFSEKLQVIRKSRGMTQESLADTLNVSRQAVTKWEAGQSYPDIANLIRISDLFRVTVDYLVRDTQCMTDSADSRPADLRQLIGFRLEANRNTYAAYMNETAPTRTGSHDFAYAAGEYEYHDTYVGGERFAGEETVCFRGSPQYAMNYAGRVLSPRFSGDFLKEALRSADASMPYRGPEYYQSGEYVYRCSVAGDFTWFQGYEEISRNGEKVYECFFHGGTL